MIKHFNKISGFRKINGLSITVKQVVNFFTVFLIQREDNNRFIKLNGW